YLARGYRHLFWDSGTMCAQLLATARALELPERLVTGFVDSQVNALLGLDAAKEGALVLAPVGAPGAAPPVSPVVTSLTPEVIPLSSSEVDYPLLRQAYDDSSLDSEAEVTAWRDRGGQVPVTGASVIIQDLTPRGLAETITRRGSTREFSGEAISREALSRALDVATRG